LNRSASSESLPGVCLACVSGLGHRDLNFDQVIHNSYLEPHHCINTSHTMKLSTLGCSLLACLSPLVSATALTYKLSANEKACFYSFVENKGAKVAFYFAVSSVSLLLSQSLALKIGGMKGNCDVELDSISKLTEDCLWELC
jgi:hypothetical protein